MKRAKIIHVPKNRALNETLKLIKAMAWAAKQRPEIKQLAVEILDMADIKNGRNKAAVAFILAQWVGKNIKYFYDPYKTETLQTPQSTLELGYGDCDDMAILLGALLMSVGIEPRFRVVGRNHPEHIFVEAFVNGAWVGYDPAATPNDPHPDSLKTYKLEGYRETRKRRNRYA